MATVKTFPALRFTAKAGDVAPHVSPPYDIVSDDERQSLIDRDPFNIIRLEKPVGENAYADAAALYKSWRQDGVLAVDEAPGFYVYEETFSALGKTYTLRGVFARVRLCDFSEGVVLPHEETLSKAKEDRFNLMKATFCNFSPIYSLYSDPDGAIMGKLDNLASKKSPDADFFTPDGVRQRLWKIEKSPATDAIEAAFAEKQLFIADGHHRYETALRFRNTLRENGTISSDADAANYVMMFLTPMENDGLVVFPTHRLVRGLASYDEETAMEKIARFFTVSPVEKDAVDAALAANADKKAFVWCRKGGKFDLLVLKDNEDVRARLDKACAGRSDAYENLDVTVLHTLILEDVFGIDKENMARQINLTYTRDAAEAVTLAASDGYDCAFLLNATRVSQIRDVALAGDKMPQKSTYFYPKLITGLVMNELLPPDRF